MIPRKGAEVAHITEKDMKDVLEVRSTLEELVVELAIKNVTDEKIEELKCANKVFESAIVSKDAVNIVEADVKFHDKQCTPHTDYQQSAGTDVPLPSGICKRCENTFYYYQ